ncbi:hypothetical protein NE237_025567 [Protea cynaroides]|uniref:Uncharacterized protein n=1 Tax=Protea cynaroides TaxID=273540 RepID=A0A9Q0K091_9MAGN|nr:hypothetical protein NE237_025567 [Protea cynaroides]
MVKMQREREREREKPSAIPLRKQRGRKQRKIKNLLINVRTARNTQNSSAPSPLLLRRSIARTPKAVLQFSAVAPSEAQGRQPTTRDREERERERLVAQA